MTIRFSGTHFFLLDRESTLYLINIMLVAFRHYIALSNKKIHENCVPWRSVLKVIFQLSGFSKSFSTIQEYHAKFNNAKKTNDSKKLIIAKICSEEYLTVTWISFESHWKKNDWKFEIYVQIDLVSYQTDNRR